MSQTSPTGPVADECAAVVHGFLEAMTAFERHLLELRPLRPFGFSDFAEQRYDDGRIVNSGSSGIEDEAEGRPEEDLVRLLQGDDITDAEKNRIMRVGVYFDDIMERKRAIYGEFWCEMPEQERAWYQHHDPPAFDPARNRIALIHQAAPDDIVVLFERETEAGDPAYRGYHLRPVSGGWRIASKVSYREAVNQLLPAPSQSFDMSAILATYHPDAAAVERAQRMLDVLNVDPLVQALEEHGGDLFAAFESAKAGFDRDERGVCTFVSLAYTAITDEGLARLAHLTDLEELNLGPKITDAGLAHLAGMTKLRELGLHEGHKYPQITGSGLVHLAGLSALEWLDLGYLPLTDEGMAQMAGPAELRELRVYHTDLTDAGLVCLAALPNLEELAVYETKITGPGLAHLAAPERLRVLDLAKSRIDDAGLAYVSRLTGLTVLNLRETSVTDAGLTHLTGLSNLRTLVLPNGITDEARARLWAALPGLEPERSEDTCAADVCGPTTHPKLTALAINDGLRLDDFFGGVDIRVTHAGTLSLPSGQVVACDPGNLHFSDSWPPFVRTVAPGHYPVRVSIAHFDSGAERVAQAALLFSPCLPVRFELATHPNEDASTLKPGEIYGHGVDSGTSCFLDLQTAHEIHRQHERWERGDQEVEPDLGVDREVHWANTVVDPDAGLNLIKFDSGIGDGFYASYWGFDAADRLACLVTDFELLTGGKKHLATCPECGTGEGQTHLEFRCNAERCPFCSEWLCACGCVQRILGLKHKERDLYDHFYHRLWWWQRPKWRNINERWKAELSRKGRVPFHRSQLQ